MWAPNSPTRSWTSLAETTTSPRTPRAHLALKSCDECLSIVGQRSGATFEREALTSSRQPTCTAQLRGDDVPHHDLHRPFHLGGARRMSVVHLVNDEEFGPQPPTQPRPRPGAQFSTVRVTEGERGVGVAQQIEPRTLFVENVRLSREERHHVALGHFAHQGKKLVANSIATKTE